MISLRLFLSLLLFSMLAHAQGAALGPLKGKAVRLTIAEVDLSDPGRWSTTRKRIDECIEKGATALVLEINVAGGNAQMAMSQAEEIARLKIRTVAFVNTSAVAGGALIACACDEIWMIQGSRIGLVPPTGPENEELSKTAQDTMMAQSRALSGESTKGIRCGRKRVSGNWARRL